jgi:hypothetical protein
VSGKFATCGKISELMLEFTGVSLPNVFTAYKQRIPPKESEREKVSCGSLMDLLNVR